MQKSVLVAIDRFVKNTKYDRVLRRTTKLMVSWTILRLEGKESRTLTIPDCLLWNS